MKESEIEKGLHIIIADDISKTKNTHNTCTEMNNMRGGKYKINGIAGTSHGKAAIVNGYYWHPNDLVELVAEKKSKRFHFNIKHLETEVTNGTIQN